MHLPSKQKALQEFVLSFFQFGSDTEVSFKDIQFLLALLCQHVDRNTDTQQTLSYHILESIVEKIHRPSQIEVGVLRELIEENKIPTQVIISLLFDDNS